MKQFNLEEYLLLLEEGKDPRIVTRDGRSVRIICTDPKSLCEEVILALVMEHTGELEVMHSYYSDGYFRKGVEEGLDLFFADLEPEPKCRPYANAEECFKDAATHGMVVKAKSGNEYQLLCTIANRVWFGSATIGLTFDELLRDFEFISGSPCGVKEGEVGRTLELEDGRTINI